MRVPIRLDYSDFSNKEIFVRERTLDVSYPQHWHNYYEMIFYNNCMGKCVLNGTEYSLEKNCIFLMTPVDFHNIDAVRKQNCRSINISFKSDVIPDPIKIINPFVIYEPSSLTELLFEEILTEYKKNSSTEYLKSMLHTLLFNLFTSKNHEKINVKYLSDTTKNIISFLLMHPNENNSVCQLAKSNGIAESYLSDLFHRETGITLNRYINELRIEYACKLLKMKEMSVLEIAYESGFGSPSQFFRTFKEIKRVSPGKYANKCRND